MGAKEMATAGVVGAAVGVGGTMVATIEPEQPPPEPTVIEFAGVNEESYISADARFLLFHDYRKQAMVVGLLGTDDTFRVVLCDDIKEILRGPDGKAVVRVDDPPCGTWVFTKSDFLDFYNMMIGQWGPWRQVIP